MLSARALVGVALTVAVVAVGGCSTPPAPADAPSPAPARGPVWPSVGRVAAPVAGSVNAYWIGVPAGLVVIDSGRDNLDGQRMVDATRATGRAVVAVLITRPHSDRVGGLGVIHQAYPQAPIYASEATVTWMRADPHGLYPPASHADGPEYVGPDYPSAVTLPDHPFAPGASLEVGGARFDTVEFSAGNFDNPPVYAEPASGALFVGDRTNGRVTPFLLEKHTCGWLLDLDQLRARFPIGYTAYPGYGDPADARAQIDEQAAYLRTVRALARPAVAPASAAGTGLDPVEGTAILADLARRYPAYPLAASFPYLDTLDLEAVAEDVNTENVDGAPPACAV